MRDSSEKCLLCKKRNANKKNSHIIPKFLGNSMLGSKQNKKGESSVISKEGIRKLKIQDIPKEDYILCEICERRLSIIENECARVLNSITGEKIKKQVDIVKTKSGHYYLLKENEPRVFHLFIYSIIWRISIASVKEFDEFRLSKIEEEDLRNKLDLELKVTKKELEENLVNKHPNVFSFHTFSIFTPIQADSTRNFIFCNAEQRNPYLLMLNDFYLYFIFKQKLHNQNSFPECTNNSNQKIKIGLVEELVWNKGRELFIKKMFNTVNKS